jgi:GNAT superfamily N-acetyltransferase
LNVAAKDQRVQIREAALDDAAELAELSGQLGYPSTTEQISRRLLGILKGAERTAFVADIGDGKLAGFVGLQIMRTLEADPRVEVTALVVRDDHRSQGIGKVLMGRAEEWARAQRCEVVGLRSNVIRERAHTFYERLGYEHQKTQKAFRKRL